MRSNKSDRGITIAIVAIILLGFAMVMYPVLSNWLYEKRQQELVNDYQVAIVPEKTNKYEEMFAKAREYNRTSLTDEIPDAFASAEASAPNALYESLFNPNDDGMMGYISIPAISLKLSIYHGVDDDSLQKGVGHLEGSALPTGDAGNHVVLAGHRGLPSAKLFTDLDLLEKGDYFYLHILDKEMAYEIESIEVVEPSDTASLAQDMGRDLVTLVTCTPYGVNTKRLLVRGHRVSLTDTPSGNPGSGQETQTNKIKLTNRYILYPLIAMVLLVIMVLILIVTGIHPGKETADKKKKASAVKKKAVRRKK